ncbi:hypothetical protein BH11ACT6_BH11ACT6_26270 [soil metagenome]
MEADLIDAIRRQAIGGATLDVTVDEPLAADSPLWSVPGIRINPHSSSNTPDVWEALRDNFVDKFERWKAGTLVAPTVADHVDLLDPG